RIGSACSRHAKVQAHEQAGKWNRTNQNNIGLACLNAASRAVDVLHWASTATVGARCFECMPNVVACEVLASLSPAEYAPHLIRCLVIVAAKVARRRPPTELIVDELGIRGVLSAAQFPFRQLSIPSRSPGLNCGCNLTLRARLEYIMVSLIRIVKHLAAGV